MAIDPAAKAAVEAAANGKGAEPTMTIETGTEPAQEPQKDPNAPGTDPAPILSTNAPGNNARQFMADKRAREMGIDPGGDGPAPAEGTTPAGDPPAQPAPVTEPPKTAAAPATDDAIDPVTIKVRGKEKTISSKAELLKYAGIGAAADDTFIAGRAALEEANRKLAEAEGIRAAAAAAGTAPAAPAAAAPVEPPANVDQNNVEIEGTTAWVAAQKHAMRYGTDDEYNAAEERLNGFRTKQAVDRVKKEIGTPQGQPIDQDALANHTAAIVRSGLSAEQEQKKLREDFNSRHPDLVADPVLYNLTARNTMAVRIEKMAALGFPAEELRGLDIGEFNRRYREQLAAGTVPSAMDALEEGAVRTRNWIASVTGGAPANPATPTAIAPNPGNGAVPAARPASSAPTAIGARVDVKRGLFHPPASAGGAPIATDPPAPPKPLTAGERVQQMKQSKMPHAAA